MFIVKVRNVTLASWLQGSAATCTVLPGEKGHTIECMAIIIKALHFAEHTFPAPLECA